MFLSTVNCGELKHIGSPRSRPGCLGPRLRGQPGASGPSGKARLRKAGGGCRKSEPPPRGEATEEPAERRRGGGETRRLRPRPPWNAFFQATHLQPVIVFLSLINVLLLKFTYAASPRQEDLIMTVATMFWGKWCFISIQNYRLKIYLLLQKKKLLLNF